MGLISGVLGFCSAAGATSCAKLLKYFGKTPKKGPGGRLRSVQGQAMAQFGAEFQVPRKGAFDRFMDGLNRRAAPGAGAGNAWACLWRDGRSHCGLPRGCRGSPWCPNRCGGCWVLSCRSISARVIRPRRRICSVRFRQTMMRTPQVMRICGALRAVAQRQPGMLLPIPARMPMLHT